MERSSAQVPESASDSAIARRADQWVNAGIIDAEQASAIVDFERGELSTGEPERFTPLTEAAAYAGCVLALMGGAAVVGPNWSALALAGQLAVSAAVVAVGFAIGTWLVHLGETSTVRLGLFLWMVGTGGLLMITAAVLGEVSFRNEGWNVVVVGAVALVAGLLLWRNADRPLQFLTAAAGLGVVSGGLFELTGPPQGVIGAWFILLGVACASLAVRRRLTPRLVTLATGSSSAYIGSYMLMEVSDHLGAGLALVVALSVVALALREGLVPLLVLAVIGSLIATEVLLQSTFTGATSATIVALLGLVVVAVAVVKTQRTAPSPP